MFTAVVEAFRKCKKCDEAEAGIYGRRDCGCTWEVVIGEYATASAARLAAMAKAKRKGTTLQGRMTGLWTVETNADGIIESGDVNECLIDTKPE